MVEITVFTKLGSVTLAPGDIFRTTDVKHEPCKYQYICKENDTPSSGFYLFDMTHEKYVNVYSGWFANRVVYKIGGNEDD